MRCEGGRDISIRNASWLHRRGARVGISAVVLLWGLSAISGCSTTAASDGPVLTSCPSEPPAAGASCVGSFGCTYGQQPCCDHLEPTSTADCVSGHVVLGFWETGCELGLVCPLDGGASDATDGNSEASGVCCPPDAVMSGCMNVGGYSTQGCFLTCDFFCSTNWRLEDDSHGCSTWRYDTRPPTSGENPGCFPQLDGGHGTD